MFRVPDFAECIFVSFLAASVSFHDAQPNFHFAITSTRFWLRCLHDFLWKKRCGIHYFAQEERENCLKFVKHILVVLSMHSVIIFQSNLTVSSFMSICVFTIAKLIKDKCLRIAITHASYVLSYRVWDAQSQSKRHELCTYYLYVQLCVNRYIYECVVHVPTENRFQ